MSYIDNNLRLTENRVTVAGVTNSIVSNGSIINASEFEKIICHNLSQDVLPRDLSENIPANTSLTVTNGNGSFGGIMISNNDDLIESETFAMSVNYATNNVNPSNDINTFSLYSNFNQNITLIGSNTTSYKDSHLRLDISYNNDLQNSILQGSQNNNHVPGDWKMLIDRSINTNNYFAAINSHLNTLYNNTYPLKINKIPNNPVLFSDTTYIDSIDPNTNEATYLNFSSTYSFNTNNLQGTVDVSHNYNSNDFTMYKLVQDKPSITKNVQNMNSPVNVSDLPICDANNLDIDSPTLSQFESNVASVIGNDINNIKDQYNINVVIGETQGGFTLTDPNNDILTIDSSSLVNSVDFLNAGISNDTPMYIDISNGSVVLQKTDTSYNAFADYNINSVVLSNGGETLQYPYNTENGLIQIQVAPVTQRVNILSASNEWHQNDVKIIYNCSEAYDNNVQSHIDVSMTVNPVVRYAADIVVPTTTGDSYLPQSNSLNLAKSNNSALVISGDIDSHNPNMENYNNVTFNSNIHEVYSDNSNNTIVFVTVQNKNILNEDTPLLDNNNNSVPNSISTVKISNIDLNESTYSDFQVKLTSKTIVDLSNTASPTNGWAIESANGSNTLHTSSIKNSILYDDCLFMRSTLDTSFNYTFSIVNPCVTNAQSIKHRIDISFNDIVIDFSGNTVLMSNQAYLDDDDITYIDVSYSNTTSEVFTDYNILNNSQLNAGSITVKRIRNVVRYRVSFDPKFPFYTNVKLVSPQITEYVDSYKLYDSNHNLLPDVYLKYLTKKNTNTPLSLVNVSQSASTLKTDLYKTTLNVTRSNCSTLTARLQGKINNAGFEDISYINSHDQDPYFNTLSEFTNVDGYTANVSVVVQVNYPTELSAPYYIIDTVNAIGSNVSFTTKLYKYNMRNKNGSNNSFDNFDPYDRSWLSGNSSFVKQLDNNITLDNNNNITLTIYGENGTSVLASINQPKTIIDDFNIIYCYNPLVRVITNVSDLHNVSIVNNAKTYSSAVLVSPANVIREVFIDDGVYAYTDMNPPRLSLINFNLKSDEVKVGFVSDSNYNAFNNGWNNFTALTNVSGNNSNVAIINGELSIELKSGNLNGVNVAKSITFDKYRGYKRVSGGIDSINILRTPSTAVFTFQGTNGTYSQQFNNFAANGNYVVDNAVKTTDPTKSVNIGLKIDGLVSLLNSTTNTSRLNIRLTGASIRWSFSNTDGSVFYDNSSNLTQSSFSQLFGWKSRNIFSSYFKIDITYNVPKIKVTNLNVSGPGVFGNPVTTILPWVNDQSYNLTSTSGFKIGGINVLRTHNYVSDSFIAYAVVIPPQLKVLFNESINSTSFPFNQNNATTGKYFISLVDPTQQSYLVNNKFYLKNNNIGYLQQYTKLKDEEFEIFGNYVNINYYYDLSVNELNNSAKNVYSGTIDRLKGLDNDKLRVTMPVNSSVYDILYRQFIESSEINVNGNQLYNIHFSISDAFIGPPPSSIYFNLVSNKSSTVAFYQSNIKLIDSSFILVIDKYVCNGLNYDPIISNPTFNKVIFQATSHYTSSFAINGKQLSISAFPVDMNSLFEGIQAPDIVFVQDNDFVPKNIGITFAGLSNQSIVNLKNLVRYNNSLFSSVFYINAPDAVNVKSLFGPSVFRVTHSGNVKTPAVTSNIYKILDSHV
jgi:hypothetical protein